MWFVFVFVGLALLIAVGIYARRRIATALEQVRTPARRIRVVRWVIGWLLWGYPAVMVVSVIASLALGRSTIWWFDGPIASWLLVFPWVWSALVVLQALPWLLVNDLAHAIVRRRRGASVAARARAIGVLLAVGGFAVYTPVRILVERGDVRMRWHDVSTASPTAPPFRIAFVADVQQDGHTDGDDARAVYARINTTAPDLVLSGGDWINTGPEYIADSAAAAATLRSRLGTFSVRGDHEHFAYIDRERSVTEVEQAMRAHGVAMLANEVRWFEHHGRRIAVAFLNYNYIHRQAAAEIEGLLARLAGADYRIAVTHQLDARLASQLAGKVDLVLGAHTHGGQINPVLGVVHVPLARLETEHVDGRYQLGPTTVIVTAGIGYSVVPVRYAAPGSVEIIELRL